MTDELTHELEITDDLWEPLFWQQIEAVFRARSDLGQQIEVVESRLGHAAGAIGTTTTIEGGVMTFEMIFELEIPDDIRKTFARDPSKMLDMIEAEGSRSMDRRPASA